MEYRVNGKYSAFVIIGFILFTIIGTISHEYGHIVVAKSLGYKTTLHYGSMNYKDSDLYKKLGEIYNENKIAIENKSFFDKKAEYEKGIKKIKSDRLFIAIGGVLQTILTGTIGLIILCYRRRKIEKDRLRLIDWLAIFLSLFWLRQVFNIVISITNEIFSPNGNYFGGDEKKIAELLGLWDGTVACALGIIGVAIFLFIVFKVISRPLRLTFILSGLIGGVLGFILWMKILGPLILP
ncbi:hypothetical protein AAON49_08325 [Pseudotenacibaculum sp. MALMAid0570]|uniref:hypothetical protein n=1 Tax=Pseudotenacibaculum sp. MALMAid0570 TaxID=3143938 RepID=UPI0032DFD29E